MTYGINLHRLYLLNLLPINNDERLCWNSQSFETGFSFSCDLLYEFEQLSLMDFLAIARSFDVLLIVNIN